MSVNIFNARISKTKTKFALTALKKDSAVHDVDTLYLVQEKNKARRILWRKYKMRILLPKKN